MPRKMVDCATPDCTNKTNGVYCKACDIQRRKAPLSGQEYRRQWHTVKKYNLTLMDFEVLWQAFRGKCGICGIDMALPSNSKGQALNVVAIDHNHVTGNIRGLLCNACNKGLGLFRDNVHNLQQAIKWLEMSNEKISND